MVGSDPGSEKQFQGHILARDWLTGCQDTRKLEQVTSGKRGSGSLEISTLIFSHSDKNSTELDSCTIYSAAWSKQQYFMV